MFTREEKVSLVAALEMMIASHVRAQKAAKLPEMVPVYEAGISSLRALLEKVRNSKEVNRA